MNDKHRLPDAHPDNVETGPTSPHSGAAGPLACSGEVGITGVDIAAMPVPPELRPELERKVNRAIVGLHEPQVAKENKILRFGFSDITDDTIVGAFIEILRSKTEVTPHPTRPEYLIIPHPGGQSGQGVSKTEQDIERLLAQLFTEQGDNRIPHAEWLAKAKSLRLLPPIEHNLYPLFGEMVRFNSRVRWYEGGDIRIREGHPAYHDHTLSVAQRVAALYESRRIAGVHNFGWMSSRIYGRRWISPEARQQLLDALEAHPNIERAGTGEIWEIVPPGTSDEKLNQAKILAVRLLRQLANLPPYMQKSHLLSEVTSRVVGANASPEDHDPDSRELKKYVAVYIGGHPAVEFLPAPPGEDRRFIVHRSTPPQSSRPPVKR